MTVFPYRVRGISSAIGRVIPISEFADQVQIPDVNRPGKFLKGELLRRLFGYQSKSWDRELFAKRSTITRVGREAIRSAGLEPSEVDGLIVVSCTPFEINLDQDAFYFARTLGLGEHIPLVQLSAGCAGIVRAFSLVNQMRLERPLILSYSLSSLMMTGRDGKIRPAYTSRFGHERGPTLWFSVATFSDGAAAAVLCRDPGESGFCQHSRMCTPSRGNPDPLVTFRGGGAELPSPEASADCVFEISTGEVSESYRHAMHLNHSALQGQDGAYFVKLRRLYLHQAGMRSVQEHYDTASVPLSLRQSHVARYGNMASPSTLVMLHEDLADGSVKNGAQVGFSVVGAGPERGVARMEVAIADGAGKQIGSEPIPLSIFAEKVPCEV